MKIGIINSGIANISSVSNMLKKIGHSSILIDNVNDYRENISHLIIPGIGSFDRGITNLRDKGFDSIIYKHIELGQPLLGICLGMQLLTLGSEEGELEGLKIINRKCIKFDTMQGYNIPHMGWNYIDIEPNNNILFKGINNPKFYFVHSYYLPVSPDYSSSNCKYSSIFCSSFQKNNTFGVQFHPEKSHKFGFSLLKNFTEVN